MDETSAWLRDTPPEHVAGRTVTLRRWTLDDVDAQVDAIVTSLPTLRPWMPWATRYDHAAGMDFLRRTRDEWDARVTFAYAVRALDDRILGGVGMHARIRTGGLEIGYWIRADATRRGHATRAAALATAVAFGIAGVTHTEIRHDRANEVSGRIPRRLGYTYVDAFERTPEAPGDSGTALRWRMTADAFPDSPAARLAAPATPNGTCGASSGTPRTS